MASSVRSPRAREIAAAARALLDEEGPEALTMRRLADRLAIRAPSLYKHVSGKEELEAAVISGGFAEAAVVFEEAVAGAEDPLAELARAYRAFALERPHLYRLMTERPLRRDLLEPGIEERAAQPLVEAAGGDESLARAVWAFAHGMTVLELNRRFPPGADLDAAWRAGLGGLRSDARS
jgi:AcrR family transcriptional regulator